MTTKHRRTRGSGSVYKLRGTYWIAYRGADGARRRESSHDPRKSVAVALLEKRNGSRIHHLPIVKNAEQLLFDTAAQTLIDDFVANDRTSVESVKRRIRLHLAPHFGGCRMASITSADVTAFVAARQTETIITRMARDATPANRKSAARPATTEVRKRVSNGEINRELQVLKRIFNLAIENQLLAMKPRIKMLDEDPPRSGFFERDQYERVLSHLPTDIQPVITFAYITGWRIASEVLTREWRHVDFEANEIRLDAGETKNREPRKITLTSDLRRLLLAQYAEHERLEKAGRMVPWVFFRMVAKTRGGEKIPQPVGSFKRAWMLACRRAGCPGKIPHDLRRTAIRNIVRSGTAESVAMTMVGHKTRSVFDRYNITSSADVREAARRLDVAAGR